MPALLIFGKGDEEGFKVKVAGMKQPDSSNMAYILLFLCREN
jgi:hypothetical protein